MLGSVATLLLALTATQDDEELARGQKFLDKVAKVWSEKLPTEKLVGWYVGRKWIGYMRLAVKAAPPNSGAAFELTVVVEGKFMDVEEKRRDRILLTPDLRPISAESIDEYPGKKTKEVLTTNGGRWKLHTEVNGEATDEEGDLKPGTTWTGMGLMLFAIPDDDFLELVSLGRKKGTLRLKKIQEKRKHRIGKTVSDYRVIEVTKGKEEPDLVYFTEDGRPVENAPAGYPGRFRPIDESEMGKDLDEPLELTPAEQAIATFFKAIKRGDKEAVIDAFDLDRTAKTTVKGFADMSDEKKKEIVEKLGEHLKESLTAEKMRGRYPEERMIEDLISGSIKTVEKDGEARVEIFGTVWKLSQASEGDRKGRWLIVGYEVGR